MVRALCVVGICVICTPALALTVSDHVKINEVYFAGSTNAPAFDGFIELYNGGGQAAYLDGALLLYGPDDFAQLAFKLPGLPGETNHPLLPGEFAVVAIDAFDFSAAAPPGLDLSGARYETYWTFEPEPRDNPHADDALDVMGIPFDWFFEPTHGQILLATGENWYVRPCEPGETCGGLACSVPLQDVVDGVEYSFQPSQHPPILRDEIDAGVIAGVAPGSGASAERVTPGLDSDNSGYDFVVRTYPSPGFQTSLAADNPPSQIVHSLEFDAIYPNPFNSETRLSFKLPQSGPVQLVVYDILGNPVRTLLSDRLNAGEYEVAWDGTGNRGILPTGVYIARLTTAAGGAAGKIILSR